MLDITLIILLFMLSIYLLPIDKSVDITMDEFVLNIYVLYKDVVVLSFLGGLLFS